MSVTLDEVLQIFQQSFPDLKLESKFTPDYYEGGGYRLRLDQAMAGGTVSVLWHHELTSTCYNGQVLTQEHVHSQIKNGLEVFEKRVALQTLARERLGPQVAVTFDARTAKINNLILSNPQAINRVLGIE